MTNAIQTVEQLEEMLSEPTQPVVELMRCLHGDIVLLGAAGKIGPSLARMARRASDFAGVRRRMQWLWGARKSDGEPGTKTLWRGLQQLDAMTNMWRLFHKRGRNQKCG